MSTRCPARSRSRILVARAFRSISRGARGSTAAGCFGKAEANPLIAVHAERSVGWADPGLVPREAQQPWRSAGFAALCANLHDLASNARPSKCRLREFAA